MELFAVFPVVIYQAPDVFRTGATAWFGSAAVMLPQNTWMAMLRNEPESWHRMRPGSRLASYSSFALSKKLWAEIYYEKELRQYCKVARCTVQKKPFWAPARARATPPPDY
jgi:hypothetical protein